MRKHAAALGYGLDCAYDLRLAGTLQEVTAGAHAQGCKTESSSASMVSTRIAISGLPWAMRRVASMPPTRHVEVHDYHIWLELQTERDRLPSIGRLTDHIEGRSRQRRPKPVSVKGVIIGDQYA